MSEIIQNFWFIQGIGAVGLVFEIISWNSKNRKKILTNFSIYQAFFIIHYFLLGTYIGAVSCVITLCRNLVFMKKGEKKWASHFIWYWVFVSLSSLSLLIFWKGWITILPVVGIFLGTYSISREKPSEMRFYMFLACIPWVPYTIVVQSYSGLISQLVALIAISIGMYRHDRNIFKDKTLAN